MGFRLSEYVLHEGGQKLLMVFLQRKGNPHDIVFTDSPGPRIHHLAYTVPETSYLMSTADLFVRAGFAAQVEFGPARHFSPGLARFLYLRDPDGHRVELFPSHYQTIDIEDEPMRWEVPHFQIGGWQEPPQRWFDEATSFANF
jgi:catechol 2,3-dioxygenase